MLPTGKGIAVGTGVGVAVGTSVGPSIGVAVGCDTQAEIIVTSKIIERNRNLFIIYPP